MTMVGIFVASAIILIISVLICYFVVKNKRSAAKIEAQGMEEVQQQTTQAQVQNDIEVEDFGNFNFDKSPGGKTSNESELELREPSKTIEFENEGPVFSARLKPSDRYMSQKPVKNQIELTAVPKTAHSRKRLQKH